jgi:hypothetical protein
MCIVTLPGLTIVDTPISHLEPAWKLQDRASISQYWLDDLQEYAGTQNEACFPAPGWRRFH